jgi:hypothetical protein
MDRPHGVRVVPPVAGELKVSPEALAETAVRDLLTQPDDAFVRLARAVVEENRELYERLR